ncbi:MAG: hypothetical protein ABJA78_12295 [Ferruginibacter sp.]
MKKIFMACMALTVFSATALLFQMTSCKKADAQTASCPVATYQVAGLWTGTYSVNSIPAQGQLFYSFVIYTDGTILTRGKGGDGKYYYSSGTWAVSGTNVFSATIISFVTPNAGLPITQSITGTYASNGTMSNLTWADTNNPNGPSLSGQYSSMQRVN